jgi:DNA primase catalytic core
VPHYTGAHRTKVDGPTTGTAQTPARQRLVAAHQAAARFFTDRLAAPTGSSPREYLRSRAFGSLLGTTRWELGYAPPSWTALTTHLSEGGFDTDELVTAGLVIRTRTGGVVDRFRDRVMLPIHDLGGDPVGFVGRAAPRADSDTPKYLNSPRTSLFDKGTNLFGLSEQQDALSSGAVPVIAEGPFDVLAISIANAEKTPAVAAVAPCGTALTEVQVSALAQFNQHRVLVAFDADDAGERAGAAAYSLLSQHFTNMRAAEFAKGFDPAKLLQTDGPSDLRQALSQDRPLADVVLDHGLRYWLDRRDNAEARAAAVHEVAPTIAKLRSDDIARQAGRLARAVGIDHSVITHVIADAVTAPAEARSTGRSRTSFSTAPFPQQRPAPSVGLL